MQFEAAQRSVRRILAVAMTLAVSACFVGDENRWADREQIVAAAARCGVPKFTPTKAGDAWAAHVDQQVPKSQAKENCIYADLQSQGFLATR